MVAAGSALNALSLVEPSEQWLLVREAPAEHPYVRTSATGFTGGRASPDSMLAGPADSAAGDGSGVPHMVPGLTVIGNSTAAHRAAVQEGSCRELRAEYAVAQVSRLTARKAGLRRHWSAGSLAAQGMLWGRDSIWCAPMASSLAACGPVWQCARLC